MNIAEITAELLSDSTLREMLCAFTHEEQHNFTDYFRS